MATEGAAVTVNCVTDLKINTNGKLYIKTCFKIG